MYEYPGDISSEKQNVYNTKDNIDMKYYKKRLMIPKGGNPNPYNEEEQTTQWPKDKVQKDKQRSKKHTHKTKGRLTRTPLKTGGERKHENTTYNTDGTIPISKSYKETASLTHKHMTAHSTGLVQTLQENVAGLN